MVGKKLIGLGLFALMAPASVSWGASVIASRDDATFASGTVIRRDQANNTDYARDDFASGFDDAHSTVLPSQTASTSASGSINDTATNTQLVASGSSAASVTSEIAFSGANLSSYSLSGSFSGSITTGNLDGYEPDAGSPNATYAIAEADGVYNSGLSLITDVALPYSMTVTLANRVGVVFNAGLIYLDFNNDTNFEPADGDVSIQDYFVIGNSPGDPDTLTKTGTLPASIHPYRIFFFGNTADGISDSDSQSVASADYTSTFSVVPEPASLALFAFTGLVLRRRRCH